MNKIEVAVLNEAHDNPAGMQLFLAKLTQRGAGINNMDDLKGLYDECVGTKRSSKAIQALNAMPHGTIKRFAPITVAIVGASRRFLAQARTNQVGLDYVSASLQYSDYSGIGQFVVPYALTKYDSDNNFGVDGPCTSLYLQACNESMKNYEVIAKYTDNDTAGYAAPQGLRNILIMQGNHQSWDYFLRLRTCNRNTEETQYVSTRIWDALRRTTDGEDLFAMSGPDCMYGKCREGKMCCGKPILADSLAELVACKWPLLVK